MGTENPGTENPGTENPGTENLSTALRVMIVGGGLIGLVCIATFGLIRPEAGSTPAVTSGRLATADESGSVRHDWQTSGAGNAPASDNFLTAQFPVPALPAIHTAPPEIQRTGNRERLTEFAASLSDDVADSLKPGLPRPETLEHRLPGATEVRLSRIERQMRLVLHRFDQSESVPGKIADSDTASDFPPVADTVSAASAFAAPEQKKLSARVSTDTSPGQPALNTASEPAVLSSGSGVSIVSEQPLRIDVHSRSTTITDLLTEFAAITGSDLVISTREDYPVRAVSLSQISADTLFALLSENQNFEILYEPQHGLSGRIKLIPHRRTARPDTAQTSTPSDSVESTTPPANIETETPEDVTVLRQPDIQANPTDQQPAIPAAQPPASGERIRIRNTRIFVRHPDSEIPEISEPATPPETTTRQKAVTDGEQRTGLQPGHSQQPLAVNSPESAMPVADPDGSSASTETISRPNTLKRFDVRATVVHLVTTGPADTQPERITPIHVPETSPPSHKSAAQYAVDQAVQLGRVTPVSDASVTITTGQSASLKIGSLCLHCNTEHGLSAGDTLRISVNSGTSGHPLITAQGFDSQSGNPLPKLGRLTSTLSGTQSFLITESGTSGSVTVHDRQTGLARLPIIGRMLSRSHSREVRQTAQRLIIVTLYPNEPGTVAAMNTSGSGTRLAAAGSIQDSEQSSPDLLPRRLTRSARPVSAGDRNPFVMPHLPPPSPASPVTTPDRSFPQSQPTSQPFRETTPAPPVEVFETSSTAADSIPPVTADSTHHFARPVSTAASAHAEISGILGFNADFSGRHPHSPGHLKANSGHLTSARKTLPKIDSLITPRHRQPSELMIIEPAPHIIPLSIDSSTAELPNPDDV